MGHSWRGHVPEIRNRCRHLAGAMLVVVLRPKIPFWSGRPSIRDRSAVSSCAKLERHPCGIDESLDVVTSAGTGWRVVSGARHEGLQARLESGVDAQEGGARAAEHGLGAGADEV